MIGSVVDSLGVGVPGARVFVAGSGTEGVTDSIGAFELTHMGEGEYSIHVTHPTMEQLWYQLEPSEVEVGPRAPNPVHIDFELPPMQEVLDDICGDEGPPSPDTHRRATGGVAARHPHRKGRRPGRRPRGRCEGAHPGECL